MFTTKPAGGLLPIIVISLTLSFLRGSATYAQENSQEKTTAPPETNTKTLQSAPPDAAATKLSSPSTKLAPPQSSLANIEGPATTRHPVNGKAAFDGVSDRDLFEQIAVSLANLETLKAQFAQTSPEGEIADGTLYLDRPGFLKFSYTPPAPQIIIARDDTIYVHDTELETTLQYEVARTPLKFLLSETLSLNDVNMVALERAQNSVALTIEAKDETLEGQLSLIFTAPDLQLIRWAVIDGRGGITLIDLSDIEENKTVDTAIFDISGFDLD